MQHETWKEYSLNLRNVLRRLNNKRNNIQHNDTWHDDTHDDTHHDTKKCNNQHYDTLLVLWCWVLFMLNVVMLNVELQF